MNKSKYTFIIIGGAFESEERVKNIKRNVQEIFSNSYPDFDIKFVNKFYSFSTDSLRSFIKLVLDSVSDTENIVLIGSSSGAVISQAISNMPGFSHKVKGLIMMGYSPITKLFFPREYKKYLNTSKFKKLNEVLNVTGNLDPLTLFSGLHKSMGGYFNLFTKIHSDEESIHFMNLPCTHMHYWNKTNFKKVLRKYFKLLDN